MEKKWEKVGIEGEYVVWRCPVCGAISFQGTWLNEGVIESEIGCDHWYESQWLPNGSLVYTCKQNEE